VAGAVAMWDGEPGLEEFLAERALVHLPYQELRRLVDQLDVERAADEPVSRDALGIEATEQVPDQRR
jgi:hypothetical protein